MTLRTMVHIGRQELFESVRTRWFLAYGATLTVLMSALAYATLSGGSAEGIMSRATAGMIHLILLVVPLMGLTAGCLSMASEREKGSLGYVLAQPVDRSEVFWGKLLGLNTGLWIALAFAFAVTGIILSLRGAPLGTRAFLALFALSALLTTTSLALGYLVSVHATRAMSALGTAVGLWFVQAFAGDLGIIGTAVAMDLGIVAVFALSLINPLQLFKVAAVGTIAQNLEVLGPVGAYGTQLLGRMLVPAFAAFLLLWSAVVLWFAWRTFEKGEYVR